MKRPAGNAAVLFNARAGRGRGQAAAERAARFMVARGWRIVARRSTPAAENDRRALICHLAAQSDRLVVVGGDGTLRETAATIHGKPGMPTLAFVPMGNANVLARELGIPRDPAEATRLLTAEHTLAVDAARIISGERSGRSVFFMAMLEIGFGAEVIRRVHRWRSHGWRQVYRLWGDLLYVPAGLMSLVGPASRAFQLKIDAQQPIVDCRLAVIANTRTYAKGWMFTPLASPIDGLLDVFGRQRANPAAIIRSYASARRGHAVQATDVSYGRGRRVDIKANRPLCLQADGEPLPPSARLSVFVLPRAIRLVVPVAGQGEH